jgi:hypothetical protein
MYKISIAVGFLRTSAGISSIPQAFHSFACSTAFAISSRVIVSLRIVASWLFSLILGIASERKETIPWSVLDDDGNLRTEKPFMLERWKSD